MKTKRTDGPDGRFVVLPEVVHRLAIKFADKHLVTLQEVLFGRRIGRRPSRSIAYARHELWVATMDKYKLSYPETGRMFGVDHTSVLAARRELESRHARLA